MVFGLDFSNPLLVLAAALVIFLLADLLLAGGGMTGGLMGGMAGMMGTPWGWIVLLVLAVLVAWLLTGRHLATSA